EVAAGEFADAPVLHLTSEDGSEQTVYTNDKRRYVFERPPGAVFSAAFASNGNVTYFPFGRWISRDQSLNEFKILLAPDYVNAGSETNSLDAWRASIMRSRLQSLYASAYPAHTRAWWSGTAGKATRFRSDYFYNNMGFHDSDIVPQESDRCI